jgi:PKD repeat protein
LTNDPTVAGTVRDDGTVTKLEASVDHGAYVDITTALVNGAFRWTPTGLAAGAHHVDVRATDNGALTAVAGTDFRVNAPPTAAAGGDRVVGEGDDVTFDAGGSVDPEGRIYAYHWAFADGTSADGKSVTRHYAQDGTDTATLTVTDSAGSAATSVAHVVVQNRAPNVRPVADVTVPQGTAYDLTASFADPGVLDAHTATIYWGDGSSSAGVVREQNGSGTVTGSHVYRNNQTYTVTVTVSDDYSPPAQGSAAFHVVSALVPPTVTISGPAALDEGSTYTLNLAARGPTPPAINSWTINWGDGTAPVTVPGYLTTATRSR